MTFPASIGADPDPTTQIPWPNRQPKQVRIQSQERERSRTMPDPSTNNDIADGTAKDSAAGPSRKRMSTMDLVNLSISMAGAQIAWTVELGYVASRLNLCIS